MPELSRMALVIAMVVVSCSGNGVAPDSVADVPETTTTLATTTTTTEGTTTTSRATTTSTMSSSGMTPLTVDYQDNDGWTYRVQVDYGGTDPNPSPGGCLDVASPGQTYLVFHLFIWNEMDDREAPTAHLAAGSNVADGQVVEEETPMSEAMIRNPGRAHIEIVPNAPDTACVSASSLTRNAGNIPIGEHSGHQMTVGPVNEDSVDRAVVGMRFFLQPGVYFQADFTTQHNSAVVGDVLDVGDG